MATSCRSVMATLLWLVGLLLATADETSWGSVTESGITCVECEYGGETFSTCGKWGASYVWCCTAAPYSNSNWEECDETPTASTWGSTDLESLGANPDSLTVCKGDCDNDADCPGASVCVQRDGGSPTTVEGCSTGDSSSTDRADTDYCNNPTTTVCDETLTGDGATYTGCQTKTRSGLACQQWNSQTPQTHNQPSADHAYCRNPDNSEDTIWCYTTTAATRFEKCDALPTATTSWGSVTKSGITCVECEYGGETFSTCGKWGASYVWCCTAAPYSNSNWEECDETITNNGNGNEEDADGALNACSFCTLLFVGLISIGMFHL